MEAGTGTPSAAAPPRRARLAALVALAVCFGAAAILQLGFLHVPADADTDYHVAVGRLIARHGILKAFPWTTFSLLAEHYADKELLFHLLAAPFAGLDPALAANAVGTVCGGLLLAALAFVLRRERVPLALAWALLPLLASPVFVFRFALVRPHLLSIALALVVLWGAARERAGVVAAGAAIYPWAYVAWPMPVALAITAEVARLLSGRRPGWRIPAAALAGLAAGLLLHPNFTNLLRFTWVQLVDVLVRNAWGGHARIDLGDEFRPFSGTEWAALLAAAAALAIAAAILAWRARARTAVPLTFALVALGAGLLTLRTARFAEYLVPFAVAAFALGVAGTARPRLALALTCAACALYSGRETVELLGRLRAAPARLSAEDARALEARIPEGAQVFTCDWRLTGTLMLALPERRFMVELDPTLFEVQDPRRYAVWYRLPREAPAGAARIIRDEFGASFVVCPWEERFRRFFDRLAFEPGVRTILFSPAWNAYDLRDGPEAGPARAVTGP